MERIEKGLVIRQPWIGEILEGRKNWEMRSKATSVRGLVALIEKGTGHVAGVARIVGINGPLSHDEMRRSFDYHRIPADYLPFAEANGWTIAWILEGARQLEDPVPYNHPDGAVTWVNLDAAVISKIEEQLRKPNVKRPVRDTSSLPSARSFEIGQRTSTHTRSSEPSLDFEKSGPVHSAAEYTPAMDDLLVPVAKDGTWFGPHLTRRGYFTIGAKGSERKVAGYEDALAQLHTMATARWRRPNPKGNWGIVSAVKWLPVNAVTKESKSG